MAVTVAKIRLGAPDSMILFGNVDLGSSLGGAELDYNPTNFAVEIDQSLIPVKVFKVKEEFSFTVALAQFQVNLITAAFGYDGTATGIVTTVTGTPNTDTAYFGNTVAVKSGTFDWTVPKNDATTNHVIGHFNSVYSAKAIKLDFKRDKQTELNKVVLMALADLTAPAGQQAGFLREQY